MVWDIIFITFLFLFMYKGYRKGAIVSLFSFLAIVIGVIAALKLSSTVSNLLFAQSDSSYARWVPLLSYAIIFILVVLLVRFTAKFIEKAAKSLMLGLINRLLGAAIYGFLVCIVFSTFYWLLNQVHIISPETIAYSRSISTLEPLAPRMFALLQSVLPFMGNAFNDLLHFFDELNTKLPTYVGINR